jgi:DNA polymerase-1
MAYTKGHSVRASKIERWIWNLIDLSGSKRPEGEKIVAVDIETNGFPWYSGSCKITTCAVAGLEGTRVYVLDDDRDLVALGKVLGDKNIAKVFHNAQFDLPMLMRVYVEIAGPIHDTILLARCANNLEPLVGLDHLGKKYCKMPKVEVDKPWLLDLETLKEYNARDAEITFLLYHHYMNRKDIEDWWKTYQLELSILPVINEMDQNAPKLNYEWVLRFLIESRKMMGQLEKNLYGVNVNSGQQMHEFLWGEEGLVKPLSDHKRGKPSKKYEEGCYSSDESHLKRAIGFYRKKRSAKAKKAVKFMEDTLTYRSWHKDHGYVKGLVKFARHNGRVHASFLPYTAKTGRWSCVRPNLQQIPGEPHMVRYAFEDFQDGSRKLKDYDLYSVDYDQMELRMGCSQAGEKSLIKIFQTGGDPHTMTAKKVGITRDHAKIVIYAWQYGIGARGLSETLRVTEEEAAEVLRDLNKGYPKISRRMKGLKRKIDKEGKLFTPTGRKFRCRESYQAFDYEIQGGGADILKMKIRQIWEFLMKKKSKIGLVMVIHDEAVFRVPKSEKKLFKQVVQMMEEKELFELPLTVSSGLFHEKG